jgi:hypothetical protein
MKAQGRLVQGLNRGGGIERSQYPADAINHIRRQLPAVVVFMEPLQALVSEALDQSTRVN